MHSRDLLVDDVNMARGATEATDDQWCSDWASDVDNVVAHHVAEGEHLGSVADRDDFDPQSLRSAPAPESARLLLNLRTTSAQAGIIDHRDGSLLVLAGAGSGKTSTIVGRTAAMVIQGVRPQTILMMTFSRKATAEMRSRLRELLPDDPRADLVNIDTYHAFGFRFCRKYFSSVGRTSGVSTMDDKDQKRKFKNLAEELGADLRDEHWKAWLRNVRSAYSMLKNEGFVATQSADRSAIYEYFSGRGLSGSDLDIAMVLVDKYETSNRIENLLDYDDLCLLPVLAMEKDPQIATELGMRYPHLVVDEFQDTNAVQYRLLRCIGVVSGNVLMVGDDDQSIYGWRGARVENLRSFISDFSPRKAKLERNFRSTPAIVDAASRHVAHNAKRLSKKPFAEGDHGMAPQLDCYQTAWQMADGIAEQIGEGVRRGKKPEDYAVLYRTNRMARVVEQGLKSRGIPYKIVGGSSIYDAPEVKAAICASRLLNNEHDISALEGLIPYLRGFGEKLMSQARFLYWSEHTDDRPNLFHLLMSDDRFDRLTIFLDEKLTALRRLGAERAGEWVAGPDGLDWIGSMQKRLDSGSAKNPEKLRHEIEIRTANLHALDAGTRMVLRRIAAVRSGAEALSMDYEGLLTIDDQWQVLCEACITDDAPAAKKQSEHGGEVTLSTVHRAKGLEWNCVHIAGYSEGLMPLSSSVADSEDDDANSDITEERRLSYVAVTRAKKQVHLHHAETVQFPGDSEATTYKPSRFIEELGLEHPDAAHGGGDAFNSAEPSRVSSMFAAM